MCLKGYFSVFKAEYQPAAEFKLVLLCLNDKNSVGNTLVFFLILICVDSTAEIMPKHI